jgi:hypothetical protein
LRFRGTSISFELKLLDSVNQDLKNVVNTVHYSTEKLSAQKETDRQVMENFIEQAKQNRAVQEISIISNSQEIVASSNPKKLGEHHDLSGQGP